MKKSSVLETPHIELLVAKMPSLTDAARVLGIDQATLHRKRKNGERLLLLP